MSEISNIEFKDETKYHIIKYKTSFDLNVKFPETYTFQKITVVYDTDRGHVNFNYNTEKFKDVDKPWMNLDIIKDNMRQLDNFIIFLKVFVIAKPNTWFSYYNTKLNPKLVQDYLDENRILVCKTSIYNSKRYEFLKLNIDKKFLHNLYSSKPVEYHQDLKCFIDNIKPYSYGIERYEQYYSVEKEMVTYELNNKFNNNTSEIDRKIKKYELISDLIYFIITNSDKSKFEDFIKKYEDMKKYKFGNEIKSYWSIRPLLSGNRICDILLEEFGHMDPTSG